MIERKPGDYNKWEIADIRREIKVENWRKEIGDGREGFLPLNEGKIKVGLCSNLYDGKVCLLHLSQIRLEASTDANEVNRIRCTRQCIQSNDPAFKHVSIDFLFLFSLILFSVWLSQRFSGLVYYGSNVARDYGNCDWSTASSSQQSKSDSKLGLRSDYTCATDGRRSNSCHYSIMMLFVYSKTFQLLNGMAMLQQGQPQHRLQSLLMTSISIIYIYRVYIKTPSKSSWIIRKLHLKHLNLCLQKVIFTKCELLASYFILHVFDWHAVFSQSYHAIIICHNIYEYTLYTGSRLRYVC